MSHKPQLSLSSDGHDFRSRVRELLMVAFGRRANRIASVPEVTATKITAAPTEVEYNKVVDDLNNLRGVVNAYHARFDIED
jgi:hypothetical protein